MLLILRRKNHKETMRQFLKWPVMKTQRPEHMTAHSTADLDHAYKISFPNRLLESK